jgi:hypothetical protein
LFYFTVVQSTIIAYWFRNKELAFSFAWKTAMSRLASVLNFFFSERIIYETNLFGLSVIRKVKYLGRV